MHIFCLHFGNFIISFSAFSVRGKPLELVWVILLPIRELFEKKSFGSVAHVRIFISVFLCTVCVLMHFRELLHFCASFLAFVMSLDLESVLYFADQKIFHKFKAHKIRCCRLAVA